MLPSVSAPPAGAPPVLQGVLRELERAAGDAAADDGVLTVRGWHGHASLCVRPWPMHGLAPHTQVWYAQGNSLKSPEAHILQGIRSLKSSHARADLDAPDQAAVSLAPTATCGANTRKLRRKLAANYVLQRNHARAEFPSPNFTQALALAPRRKHGLADP